MLVVLGHCHTCRMLRDILGSFNSVINYKQTLFTYGLSIVFVLSDEQCRKRIEERPAHGGETFH